MKHQNLRFGTCSWNYPSWQGLVYTRSCKTAAEYLAEYCRHFRTAEIDSWFYRVPPRAEVLSYRDAVDADFRFTCKVPQEITLTHQRGTSENGSLMPNRHFLSPERFKAFIDVIEPLIDRMDAVMLEFEYLNKQKMPSQEAFMEKIGTFLHALPAGLPLAVECRNSNYINAKFFGFLKETGLIPVFSEKMYMPHVYDVYAQVKPLIGESAVIRLLGGDRKAMEEKTGNKWNAIVDEKNDKDKIFAMVVDMLMNEKSVTVNVNNHYEGSAPLTSNWFLEKLAGVR